LALADTGGPSPVAKMRTRSIGRAYECLADSLILQGGRMNG